MPGLKLQSTGADPIQIFFLTVHLWSAFFWFLQRFLKTLINHVLKFGIFFEVRQFSICCFAKDYRNSKSLWLLWRCTVMGKSFFLTWLSLPLMVRIKLPGAFISCQMLLFRCRPTVFRMSFPAKKIADRSKIGSVLKKNRFPRICVYQQLSFYTAFTTKNNLLIESFRSCHTDSFSIVVLRNEL